MESQDEGNLTSVTEKVKKQIILETVSKYMKHEKVMWSSQHQFTKEQSCLTNLTTYHEMTS